MSICMRCGGNCTCYRHGSIPEDLYYYFEDKFKPEWEPDRKGKMMPEIRSILDKLIVKEVVK